jgi:hypothetical protein
MSAATKFFEIRIIAVAMKNGERSKSPLLSQSAREKWGTHIYLEPPDGAFIWSLQVERSELIAPRNAAHLLCRDWSKWCLGHLP